MILKGDEVVAEKLELKYMLKDCCKVDRDLGFIGLLVRGFCVVCRLTGLRKALQTIDMAASASTGIQNVSTAPSPSFVNSSEEVSKRRSRESVNSGFSKEQ